MDIASAHFNIASYLHEMAKRYPAKKAVISQKHGTHYTFVELDDVSDRYAHGLIRHGIEKGDRVVLMVRPGLDFIALTYALFKAGAVPVLIDPGMGRDNLFKCIADIEPKGFIAVPIAHVLRVLHKIFLRDKSFKSVEHFITVGRRWFWGGATLNELTGAVNDDIKLPVTNRTDTAATSVTLDPNNKLQLDPDDKEPSSNIITGQLYNTKRNDTAAILFTTGSTGIPKGVVYEHGMFDAQVRIIRDTYGITDSDVDLPAFPLFALFDTAWGITSVIPDMDPGKPAGVDPKKIVTAISDHGVTITFGSPAIWGSVGAYCTEKKITLPDLTRIFMAGAPVPGTVLARFKEILTNGETYTPYGATESLPVTSISGSERLDETEQLIQAGKGCCVGRPLEGMTVKVIRLTEDEIPDWDDSLTLPEGGIGEIVVKGAVVTKEYFNREKSTKLAKIRDGETVWHRMGDVGYFDADGRLFFCGRKAHRVVTKDATLFSVMCEGVFNTHDDVFRSALVGIGEESDKLPVIIIEPHKGKMPKSAAEKKRFIDKLIVIGGKCEVTKGIKRVLFHPDFPVDIRHNAKIFREKLAVWAKGVIARRQAPLSKDE